MTAETPVEREALGLASLLERPLRGVDVVEHLTQTCTISTRAREKALSLAGGFTRRLIQKPFAGPVGRVSAALSLIPISTASPCNKRKPSV